MAKLAEELVHIEDLALTIDDMDAIFRDQAPHWWYRWYRIENNREEVLLVAYETKEELFRREAER